MATRQSSWTSLQAETLYKLKEQLTCSVCMEQYTSPKILPCFHAFCLHCLRGIDLVLEQDNSQCLPCPTCRSPCQLSQEGVDGLYPCYFINNLTETCNLLKKVSGKGHTSCEKCHKQDVDGFCRQCVVFLCQECLQLHNEWFNHEILELNTMEFSITATLFDHAPIVDRMSTVTVSLSLEDGSPAPVPLSRFSRQLTSPTSQSPPVSCTVNATSQIGQYSVVFIPLTEGTHLLHVKLHNGTNPGCDISVTVPVKSRGSVVKTITGLTGPDRVAVSDDGQLFISNSNQVTVVTRNGEMVKSFCSNMRNPSGIAFTPEGALLVVDWGNHCLLKFTRDGEYISSVGDIGYGGPLEFIKPRGIAINKTTGQVYIADTGNHRVQVLNADLTFSHSIESVELEFFPCDVAVDGQGFVYVADRRSVWKFNPDGSKVLLFVVNLYHPKGITVDDSGNVLYITHGVLVERDYSGLIYVTIEKPRISVCCMNTGEVKRCFGDDSLSEYTTGCAFEQTTGYLYVCNGHRINIY